MKTEKHPGLHLLASSIGSNNTVSWDIPEGPVVSTLSSSAGRAGSIPGQGARTPRTSWPKNQNIKEKQYGI